MNNFRFISYKETPKDPYGVLGIATVVVYGKVILRYKHVKKKDGNGDFFAAATYGIDEGAGKTYLNSFGLDSRAEEEELLAFVRFNVKASQAQNLTEMASCTNSGAMFYTPHQMSQDGPRTGNEFEPMPF